MRKLADTPISLRLTGAIWLMLLFAWGGMIVWETRVNRETAIDQAQDFARSIHEMTMAGLTGMMITGTVGAVGGEDSDTINDFIVGYTQGAEYYGTENGKAVTVKL